MIVIKTLNIILLFYFTKIGQSYNPPWTDGFTETGIWKTSYFCKNNSDMILSYKIQPSIYYVWINEVLDNGTEITVKFDAEPYIYVNNEDITRVNSNITKDNDVVNNIYTFKFTNRTKKLKEIFRVEGNTPYHQTLLTSLKINGTEKCQNPDLQIFNNDRNYQRLSNAPDKFCGRKKIREKLEDDPLTTKGPGSWPWLAAIYIVHNATSYYICGGTLISSNLVMTAANCVTIRNDTVATEVLEVALGDHAGERQMKIYKVTEVIVHEEYNYTILNNDIALLKLKDNVNYNNYVQPACLWYDEVNIRNNGEEEEIIKNDAVVLGTIVGLHFDEEKSLNNTLDVVTIPIVPDVTCLLYQPVFYHILLNGFKFCAGPQNGTVPCKYVGNAFMVFIEDYKPSTSLFGPSIIKGPGAWYIKGIVSATLKSYDDNVEGCDPEGYAVFTDVDKYRGWIIRYINNSPSID